MIRTMVQLTEEQLKALKELAKARKTSVASLVRESVEQYMTVTTQDPPNARKNASGRWLSSNTSKNIRMSFVISRARPMYPPIMMNISFRQSKNDFHKLVCIPGNCKN